MYNIPTIQWPLIKSFFLENVLEGILFNPLFITHYCDVWLGWYVNKIYNYSCPLASEFHISNVEHKQSSTTETDIWDTIIFLCLKELNSSIYHQQNISKDIFLKLSKEIKTDIDVNNLYEKYSNRSDLYKKYCLKHDPLKTRNLDISFIISNIRERKVCQIDKIIETIKNYNYPSYEIVIFSNQYNYSTEKVICLQEEDFGATWGFNRCYSVSSGKNIVELTDNSIPSKNIFNFIKSPYLIRSATNLKRKI